MEEKNLYYGNKIREIAKQLEQLRTEIYQQADKTQDIEFFEHTDNMLFKTQNHLANCIAEAVELLDYKE